MAQTYDYALVTDTTGPRGAYPMQNFEETAKRYGAEGWRVVSCVAPDVKEMQPNWWILFERPSSGTLPLHTETTDVAQ